jgi:hypothetical protein
VVSAVIFVVSRKTNRPEIRHLDNLSQIWEIKSVTVQAAKLGALSISARAARKNYSRFDESLAAISLGSKRSCRIVSDLVWVASTSS